MPKNPFASLPALKQLKSKIKRWPSPPDLLWRYQVGQLIARLHRQADGEKDRFGQLAAAVDDSRVRIGWLIQHRLFFLHYGERLDKVAANERSSYQLTWCHIQPLMTIDDLGDRTAMEKDCRRNRWSVSQLRAAIKSKYGQKKTGGRPFAGYSGTVRRLDFWRDVEETSRTWLRKYEQVWQDATLRPGKPLDVEFLDEMTEAIEELRAKMTA